MNGFKSLCAFIIGLCFGVVVVWIVTPSKRPPRADSVSVGRTCQKSLLAEHKDLRSTAEAEEERRLVERIAEIEGELRAAKSDLTSAETNAEARSGRPLSYNEWFALQREADPARYAILTNGVVQSHRRSAQEYATRAELLDTVDTSAFGDEAAAVHKAYRDALVQIADLRRDELARRCASTDFNTGNSPEFRRQMEEAGQRIYELEWRERFLLLGEAGRLYGLTEKDALELAETLHRVIETTSSSKRMLKPQREKWESRLRE